MFAGMKRPEGGEHAAYYSTYIDEVPDRSVIEVLREAPDALEALLSRLPADREAHAYEPGKWTIREVLGHVIDTERVFSYRALHMARSDPADLPSMDQDEWAAASNANQRSVADLLAEFRGLRAGNTVLFASFDDETLSRRGTASDLSFSVRALIYIVAGHELHHRGVLSERYLDGAADQREGRA